MMTEKIIELYTSAQVAERIKTLAAEISEAYKDRDLVILSSHEDCFIFLADLLRNLNVHPQTAFLRFAHNSFGGVQDISFTTTMHLRKKDVLLVTGVLETGVTQEYLMRQIMGRGAHSVKLCVLLNKTGSRHVELQPDWFAFETNEDYVFGYGLEFQERWRELPFLATVARGDEKKSKSSKTSLSVNKK